mmetsp:Transcript_24831/g.55106  ORF Transcript_24831/g.55106 Transcript_24831/m.55106 type:complete len:514 (-) Transcript_24831:51-1592(-)
MSQANRYNGGDGNIYAPQPEGPRVSGPTVQSYAPRNVMVSLGQKAVQTSPVRFRVEGRSSGGSPPALSSPDQVAQQHCAQQQLQFGQQQQLQQQQLQYGQQQQQFGQQQQQKPARRLPQLAVCFRNPASAPYADLPNMSAGDMLEGVFEASKNLPLYRQSAWDASQLGEVPYMNLTVVWCCCCFVLEYYLDIRQRLAFYTQLSLAPELKGHISDETFKKSTAYNKDKFSFKMVESMFMFVESLVLMLAGYLPYAWDQSALIAASTGLLGSEYSALFQEILITFVFVVMLTTFDTFVSLPFSLYGTFVVEQKHGFNKSTLGLFFQDKVMTLGLTFLLGFPILSLVVWIVRTGGEYFYFYVWVFLCIVNILLMTIYPTLIAPLFNKYTPLEEGETKTAIEELATSVQFPLTNLFTVDGSKRSAHSNAYFYGFFKNKRIVLYDTLLKQVPACVFGGRGGGAYAIRFTSHVTCIIHHMQSMSQAMFRMLVCFHILGTGVQGIWLSSYDFIYFRRFRI